MLTIVNGETFRLPLNDYFLGDGINYKIVTPNTPFTVKEYATG